MDKQQQFYQKTGTAVVKLAQLLMAANVNQRLESISDYQEKLGFSRGTIQNALKFLKDQGAVTIKNQGHLGSLLIAIDYQKLQSFAIQDSMTGTMPLPYSKSYEGLATGLHETFREAHMKLNLAYVRGSENRIAGVSQGMYQFAIVSKYAAVHAIKEQYPLEICLTFKEGSFLSKHVLLSAKEEQIEQITDGQRIGIDWSSIDQKMLTQFLVQDKKITYVDMPGHQIIQQIRAKVIDVGIWNYDEIAEKKVDDIFVQDIHIPQIKDYQTAVLIIHKEDTRTKKILAEVIKKERIEAIIAAVKTDKKIPMY